MTKTEKNVKLFNDFIFKRFITIGILDSANVDRLMFKNQHFVEFINKDIVKYIYPEIKKTAPSPEKNHNKYIKWLIDKFYIEPKSFLYNTQNAILNNIKNAPFENNNLFEILNTYKYKIKKIFIFPLFSHNNIQFQYILKKMFAFLEEHGLKEDYFKETYGFTINLHINEQFNKILNIVKKRSKYIGKTIIVDKVTFDKEDELQDSIRNSKNTDKDDKSLKGGSCHLKTIILEKLERYIDIRDITEDTEVNINNTKTPHGSKRHAIVFLLRVIAYIKNKDTSVKYDFSDVQKIKEIKELEVEMPHTSIKMDKVVKTYLKKLRHDDEIIINEIPEIAKENKKNVALINKLLNNIVDLIENVEKNLEKSGGNNVTEKSGGNNVTQKLKKTYNKMKIGIKNMFNKTKRKALNLLYKLKMSKYKHKILKDINNIFYYSFEKMVDDQFTLLADDIANGKLSKRDVMIFFSKTTIGTFIAGNVTCTSLLNFMGYIFTELPSLFLFSIGKIPIYLTIQTVSCISSSLIAMQLFYFYSYGR